MEFIIAILILACVVLSALCGIEAGERDDARFTAKCYCAERDEEIELRRKAEDDIRMLFDEKSVLERRCEGLQDTCDALAHENADMYSERERLRKCTVEYAFSDWERRERVDATCIEYERDGIVLMYDGGKMVGWHGADTVQVRFKREKKTPLRDPSHTLKDDTQGEDMSEVMHEDGENGRALHAPTIGEGTCIEDVSKQGTYEAPSAEVVDKAAEGKTEDECRDPSLHGVTFKDDRLGNE